MFLGIVARHDKDVTQANASAGGFVSKGCNICRCCSPCVRQRVHSRNCSVLLASTSASTHPCAGVQRSTLV